MSNSSKGRGEYVFAPDADADGIYINRDDFLTFLALEKETKRNHDSIWGAYAKNPFWGDFAKYEKAMKAHRSVNVNYAAEEILYWWDIRGQFVCIKDGLGAQQPDALTLKQVANMLCGKSPDLPITSNDGAFEMLRLKNAVNSFRLLAWHKNQHSLDWCSLVAQGRRDSQTQQALPPVVKSAFTMSDETAPASGQGNVAAPVKGTGNRYALLPGTQWSSVAIRVSHLKMTVDVGGKKFCIVDAKDIPIFYDSRQSGMTQSGLWNLFDRWAVDGKVTGGTKNISKIRLALKECFAMKEDPLPHKNGKWKTAFTLSKI